MTLFDILLFMAGTHGALAIMALFLVLALGTIVAVAIHDAIEWWWNCGVTRRRQRLGGRS